MLNVDLNIRLDANFCLKYLFGKADGLIVMVLVFKTV